VARVCRLAARLLESEAPASSDADVEAVCLTAALHDVGDHKYLREGEDRDSMLVEALSASSPAAASRVRCAVPRISFSYQKLRAAADRDDPLSAAIEVRVVRDADRLDAIGAVGVARCFTFGGSRLRSLADSREHFDEKLLLIRDALTTSAARALAVERHDAMVAFLRSFDEEVAVAAAPSPP